MRNGGRFCFSLSLALLTAVGYGSAELTITGNVYYSSDYLLRVAGQFRDPDDSERTVYRLLDHYHDNGFPFCRIRVHRIDDATVRLQIAEGPRVEISDAIIRTTGGTRISEIRRISRLSYPALFSRSEVLRARSRITATGAFAAINEQILQYGERHYLLLDLTEQDTDFASASGSFGADPVSLSASLESRNILGTLRSFRFDCELDRRFAVSLSDPVLVAPVVAEVSLDVTDLDSVSVARAQFQVAAPAGGGLHVAAASGVERVRPRGGNATLSGDHSFLAAGLSWRSESRFPIDQQCRVEYLVREPERVRLSYQGSARWRSIEIRPNAQWVSSDTLYLQDLWRIGGATSVRGYEDDAFYAERAYWLNAEYHRFPVFPLIDVAFIGDAWYYSYGIGFAGSSRIGTASVVLAWAFQAGWREGKLHICLGRGI